MKKLKVRICLLILFSFIFANAGFAQEEQEEKKNSIDYSHAFTLGYGAPNSFLTSFINTFTAIIIPDPEDETPEDMLQGPGVFQIGYGWYPLDWLSVGALCTYEPFRIVHTDGDNKYVNPNFFWSIQGEVGFHYGWELVRLYHELSAGIGVCHNKDTPAEVFFAFNIIPIGIEVGKSKGIFGFADLGLGTTAYINAGIGYRL